MKRKEEEKRKKKKCRNEEIDLLKFFIKFNQTKEQTDIKRLFLKSSDDEDDFKSHGH